MMYLIIFLLFFFTLWLFIRKSFKSQKFGIDLHEFSFIYFGGDGAKFERQQCYSSKDMPYLCRADR